jgi:phosphoribosylformimino-5-aminoimidazole carboxamide ribotide isomerase
MIHLVDLDATLGSGSNFDILKNVAESVKIPVQVAGGLRSEKIIEKALGFAQRVVVGTLAFKDKTALNNLLATHGNEKLVISVDHNNGFIVVNGWKDTIKTSLIDAVKDFREMGFSEYLSTSIVRDGTLQGPDLKSLQMINEENLDVNIILSGGISNIDDVIKVKELNPFGVILGKALYENQIAIEEAKRV